VPQAARPRATALAMPSVKVRLFRLGSKKRTP
jgi:hypothetical protein